MSLTTISATGLFKYTPEECWEQGTNIKTALRVMPEETRAAVISMIKKTVDFCDEKKTLASFEDVALCAEMIFEITAARVSSGITRSAVFMLVP